ncbi:MAG: glycosyltransferase family 39 protein [Myxococcota bacterium]
MSVEEEVTDHSRAQLAVLAALLALLGVSLRTPWAENLPLAPILIAVVILGVCHFVGLALVALILGERLSEVTLPFRTALALALGMTVVSTTMSALAGLQLLSTGPMFFVLALLGVGGFLGCRVKDVRMTGVGSALVDTLWRSAPHPLLALVAAAFFALAFVAALAPPLYYDALVYHHALPRLYLDHGGFTTLPGLIYSNFPLLLEMLSAPAIAIDATGVAANLLNTSLLFILVVTVLELGTRLGDRRTGWLAAFLALSCPTLLTVGALPTSDLAVSAFGALSVATLLRRRDTGLRWLVLGGLVAGAAVASKSISTALVLPVVVLVVLAQPVAPVSRRVMHAAGVGVVALLVNLPMYVKNALLAGNPVMPALFDVLGGRHWTPEQHAQLMRDAHQAPLTVDHALQFPMTLLEYLTAPTGALDGTYVGVLFPVLLVPAFVVGGGLARRLAVVALVQALLWHFTFPQARFVGPMAVTLALLCALGLRAVLGVRWVGGVVVGLAALSNLSSAYGTISWWQGEFLPVSLGLMDRDTYLANRLEYVQAVPAARQALKPGQKLLMFGEGRSFHMDVPLIPTSALDVSPLRPILQTSQNAREVQQKLTELGVGAILLRPGELARLANFSTTWQLSPTEKQLLDALLSERATLTFKSQSGMTYLFVLKDEP